MRSMSPWMPAVAAAAAAAVATVLAPAAAVAALVDVVELSGSEIKSDLLSGDYTARDLVDSYLERIDTFNPNYNAFTLLDRAGARAQAAALDAALAAGPTPPAALAAKPLLGSVVVIKDSMNVGGQRTTSGFFGFTSEYTDPATGRRGVDIVAKADAPIVARLRDAGAIILGKTNLPSFARSGANANSSTFGPTFNAVVRSRAPGGSSTGTATAVSGSFATMGTAEETGGSIQNPAGAQGLVGIKTTFGLIPTFGGVPLSGSTRDVFGPNAKTVRDAANMLTAIAGYDGRDPNTARASVGAGNIPAAGYAAGLTTTALAGKRFGIYQPGAAGSTSGAFKNTALTPDVQARYDAAKAVLVSQGATLVSDVFAGSNFQSLGGYSIYGSTNLPYEINQFLKDTADPAKSPTSAAAFKAATNGIDLLQPSGPLIGAFSTVPDSPGARLQANAANPDVSDTRSVADFMAGRAIQLREFQRVLDANSLDGLFFPQQSAQPGLMPGFGGTGGYSSVTVSEINLIGTPQVNMQAGAYADGTPFSVAFLGDEFTEAELLAYAFDFEQAIAGTPLARTAPTLFVPEPGTAGMLVLCGVAFALRRGRRPAVAGVGPGGALALN